MSLVLRIQQLVDTLFENISFQSKLKSFYETECTDQVITKQPKSIRTDTSDKLQQSESKLNYQVDILVGQIEELLGQVYQGRNCKKQFQDMELCQIYEDMEQVKKQLHEIKNDYKNEIHVCKYALQEQIKFVTMEQHRQWQQQIFQKIDIIIKRNQCKLESIFADKLNSIQMNFSRKKQEQTQQKSLQSSFVINFHVKDQSEIKPKDQIVKKKNFGVNYQLAKKLTSAKSLGSLFGFKK